MKKKKKVKNKRMKKSPEHVYAEKAQIMYDEMVKEEEKMLGEKISEYIKKNNLPNTPLLQKEIANTLIRIIETTGITSSDGIFQELQDNYDDLIKQIHNVQFNDKMDKMINELE